MRRKLRQAAPPILYERIVGGIANALSERLGALQPRHYGRRHLPFAPSNEVLAYDHARAQIPPCLVEPIEKASELIRGDEKVGAGFGDLMLPAGDPPFGTS